MVALKKHIESGHSDIGDVEKEQYITSLNANSAVLASIIANSQKEKMISAAVGSAASHTATVNSITSPVVCATTSEKSDVTKTDLNSNETSDKCESMDAESLEGSDKSSVNDGSENLEGVDPAYRDQQFLEDYMNSQAMAEGSYEDPNRKFKCHRCKVAFTKQSYLTAHNKTLLHRKGDKMSYPMEKYLDPNRPFKCDICKESFTQKNILLVHYNSVSHLHKVKQVSQNGSLPISRETTSPIAQQESSPLSSSSSSVETSTTSSSPSTSSTANGETDKSKPYKCNICKVSYSQGTTLDIHIRSVGHQTRTSKLHELVLLGQVDLAQPLIEQPNDSSKSQQQQKLLAEMLQLQPQQFLTAVSQPSLLFPGIPGFPAQIPMLPGLPIMTSPESLATGAADAISYLKSQIQAESKQGVKKEGKSSEDITKKLSTEDTSAKSATLPSPTVQPTYLCQRCNAVFTNQDSLTQHQLVCLFQTGSPLSSQQQQQIAQAKLRQTTFLGRVKPQIQRNLLENIGFECVMQFNEFNQACSIKEEDSDDEDKDEPEDEKKEEKEEVKKEEPLVEKMETEEPEETDLPEMNKCVCTTCSKEFSSVWVLKAHQEEVHRDVVPIDLVEDFGEKFKSDYEKKQPKESENTAQNGTASETTSTTANGQGGEGEGSNGQDMPPPPPPPQISPQMDLAQMMPMFGLGMPMPMPFNMSTVMNMQPSLMPMMFPLPTDTSVAPSTITQTESNLQTLQKQQAAQLAAQQAAMNQKRARTRINDEQLKILRAHFDINNSPSEEQIMAMSEQSGLPTKVIKHWFRNTLFKERQRNKDSPYNFSVAPTTTLDLEEYEKTGKIPVVEESPDAGHKEIKKEPVEHDEEVGRAMGRFLSKCQLSKA